MESTLCFPFFYFFIVATILASCHAESATEYVQFLRPKTGASGRHLAGVDCLSWRLAVETNNIIEWNLVPQACEDYIGHYMLGKQYKNDCNTVAAAAFKYAKSLNLTRDVKNVWVFDIDETTLSNLPYYARSDVAFGAIKYNDTKFNEWIAEGKAVAVPGSVKLYEKLVGLGFKIVFLSGTRERFREIRTYNLKAVGYKSWEKLILKGASDTRSAVVYKSNERAKLEAAGYRILGNMGDQWSDIIGTNVGSRTFKVPDPMYYIS